MHRYDEEYLGAPIPSWAQRLVGVVLMIAALSVAWFLITALDVFPPMTLIVAGAFLIAGGVFMLLAAWSDGAPRVDDGLSGLLLGSWAIRFGMSRRKRSTSAHGSTP